MRTFKPTVGGLAAIVLAVGGAGWLLAGPINPPGGPVGPTGVSLTDLAGQIGGVVPGNAFAGPGTMSMSIGGVPISVPVYSVQQTLSGGVVDGAAQLTPSNLLVVTDIGSALVTLGGAVKSGAQVQSFVLTMPRAGGVSGVWSIQGTGKIYLRSIAFSGITKANGQIAQVAVVEVLTQASVSPTGMVQAQALQYSIDGVTLSTKY